MGLALRVTINILFSQRFFGLKKISFFIYNVFIAHHKTIQDSLSDQFSDLFFFLFQFFQSFVNGFVKSVR